MRLPSLLTRRLAWLNLPVVTLVALLQRSPALRIFATSGDYAITSSVGQVLRAAATLATLGAMHSRAGATTFIGPSGPVNGTVGTQLSVGFTYNGTPSSPARFTFSGSLPPGLNFIPAPNGNTIPSGTPVIAGTPTAAGEFIVEVQGFNAEGLTNSIQQSIVFNITGGSSGGPTFTTQPSNQSASAGGSVTLSVTVSGATGVQWQQNGNAVAGATASSLTIPNVQSANAGLYVALANSGGGSVSSRPAILGVGTSQKVIGNGFEIAGNIAHPNGNIFDQVLLDGAAASVTAKSGQVTRISFIDLDDDIVQVEFAGPGTLTLVLDGTTSPAPPQKYNQPAVSYMKGHAGLIVTGATEGTNLSVFSVGRATAFDPTGGYNILQGPSETNNPANNGSSLFAGMGTNLAPGIANVSFIAISSVDGRFGGIRAANASLFATKGITGVYAPDVQFTGPVFVSDINAFDNATPMLVVGSITSQQGSRITGGDLEQANGRAVQVSGLTQLVFAAGSSSHGTVTAAQTNKGQLEQNGSNVTSQIVVNP